jgi:hypothetical protein
LKLALFLIAMRDEPDEDDADADTDAPQDAPERALGEENASAEYWFGSFVACPMATASFVVAAASFVVAVIAYRSANPRVVVDATVVAVTKSHRG